MIEKLKEYNEVLFKKNYNINLLHWELMLIAPVDATDYLIDLINDEQMELFKLSTSEEYEKLLEDYLNSNEADKTTAFYKVSLNNYNNLIKSRRLPEEFLNKYNKVLAKSNKIWEIAKEKNDYEMFKPYLKDVIDVTKQYYRYYEPDMNLYDAMLNYHEKGVTASLLDKLFAELKQELIPLIKKVKKDKPSNKNYLRNYSTDELMECAKVLLEYIGFDMNRGALGIYPHGFMEKMNTNDIRIAFSKTNDPVTFVSTIIHEGGHALFEQNTDKSIANENIELYALHESQSRFFENVLGRNINFWYPIYDKVKEILKLDLDINEFVDELNYVIPSKIRVNADELTFCLHIIIRYEIEKDIFNDSISVEDLPTIWNEKMKEYLGVEIDSYSDGLMQDVHWSEGSFGYFPSYLVGNIYDGMYIENIESNLGNIDEILKNGRIKDITKYLSENIHINGGAYSGLEVINRMCNKQISVEPLINYFKNKYK